MRLVNALYRLTLSCTLGMQLVSPLPAQSPGKESRWNEIESRLGQIALDGTLRWKRSLGANAELDVLGINFYLEHRIERDARGRARSAWQLSGLTTFLVPEGRDVLRWQPPSGAAVRFERAKIGRALSGAGSQTWSIRELGRDTYEIRALDGRVWRYVSGELTMMRHPSRGQLVVSAKGGKLQKVSATKESNNLPILFVADYDDGGRLNSLTVGSESTQRFVWGENDGLQSWLRADNIAVYFAYDRGLVSEISEGLYPPERFSWEENPGWERSDSKWPAPVHLTGDATRDYRYELSPAGFSISASKRQNGQVIVTVFNPRRSVLKQSFDGGTLFAQFRKNAEKGSQLLSIRDGDGTCLEEYIYDGSGKITRVRRQGEPDRTFIFDDDGRLMRLAPSG